MNFHIKKKSFRPIDQRSIISLTSFLDVLQYVDNLKKHSNSRPNSMTSSTAKMEGKIYLIFFMKLVFIL
jgi:hypothetical protein